MTTGSAHDAPLLRVVNPLPRALHHYQRELSSLLDSFGDVPWVQHSIGSAEIGRLGKVQKLQAAAKHVRTLRSIEGPFIEVWPAIGHLEAFGVTSAGGAIIHHDPVPIRQQVGYGALSVRASVLRANHVGMTAVAHSRAAERRLREFGYTSVVAVPHPILLPERRPSGGSRPVRVLGQFKPARDLDLLRVLGPMLRREGLETEIVGRGWPAIEGWNVRNEFVEEDQLTELISTSSAVVIPYRRYWQSGIAIRAFEAGVPVVGTSGGFLDELYGGDLSLLVGSNGSPTEWVERIRDASRVEEDYVVGRALAYHDSGKREWRGLIESLSRRAERTE